MWEKQLSTQETVNAVQDGTTLVFWSEKWSLKAEARHDLSSNQWLLSMVNGDYVWQSDLLDVSPLLPLVGTVQLIREGLERWLLLATLHCTRQGKSLTPLESTTLLYTCLEHVLA